MREPAFADQIHTVDLHNQAADIIEALVEALETFVGPNPGNVEQARAALARLKEPKP